MEILVVLWLACGVASMLAAAGKGRSGVGWGVLGILLGPLGLLGAAVASPDRRHAERAQIQSGKFRKCPNCAELILREAKRCKHCASDVTPLPPRDIWGREQRQ